MRRIVVIALALGALMLPTADAQLLWGDNFDNLGPVGSPSGPYTPGPVGTFGLASGGQASLTNGGWDCWYATAGAEGGISNTTFRSAPNSLEVGGVGAGGCDMVQNFSAVSGLPGNPGMYDQSSYAPGAFPQTGVWEIRAWNYCPSSFPTGNASHYFIVNDQYDHAGGLTTWCMQVQFNHATGMVADDQRTGSSQPIVYDMWVELVATFDLDNQCAAVSYGGAPIGNGPFFVTGWNAGTGPVQLANIDLFTTGATSFWDDITLTQIAGAPYQANTFDAVAGSGIDALVNSANGSSCAPGRYVAVSGTNLIGSIQTNFGGPYDGILYIGSAIPRGAPGSISLPDGQVLNVPIPGLNPLAFWLSSPTIAPIFGITPAAPFGLLASGGAETLFNIPTPISGTGLVVTLQFGLLDGLSTNGISLSQPCEIQL